MVHAIKMGWMKPRPSAAAKKDEDNRKYYMLWQTDDQVDDNLRRVHDPIPAPKMKVPGWDSFIKERFTRCMDLYLAPRQRRMRLTIQPEDLVPQLPKPQDLQPFPTVCSITFKGHSNLIRSLDVEPVKGQYLASGSDDGTVRLWELATGRCTRTLSLGSQPVKCVSWCPNPALSLIAVATENRVLLINTNLGDRLVNKRTDELVGASPDNTGYVPPSRVSQAVKWSLAGESADP